jgi:FtsH-binding integral membrane protein
MSEQQYTQIDENGDTKEEFCGACLAVPLALVGAGAAGVGAKQKGRYKKMKNILLWGGIALTVVSVIVAIIYLRNCKNCR